MKKVGMQHKYSYKEMWQPKNYELTLECINLILTVLIGLWSIGINVCILSSSINKNFNILLGDINGRNR